MRRGECLLLARLQPVDNVRQRQEDPGAALAVSVVSCPGVAWQPCVEVALNSPSVELEEASQPGWDDLQAIADAPTKVERRRLAGDLKAKSENGSLTGLQTDRLLVQGSGNLWCLAPSFIADLLARDHVRELLAQSEVAGWASL